jgi:hypothetical protein
MSITTRTYEAPTSENAALVLIDRQVGGTDILNADRDVAE